VEKAAVRAFAFAPDSHVLAYSEFEDKSSVTFHPLVDSQNSRTIDGGPALLYRLVFSPDGALLASAGEGVKIWHVDTGQLLYAGKATCP